MESHRRWNWVITYLSESSPARISREARPLVLCPFVLGEACGMGPPWCPPPISSTRRALCRTRHHYLKSDEGKHHFYIRWGCLCPSPLFSGRCNWKKSDPFLSDTTELFWYHFFFATSVSGCPHIPRSHGSIPDSPARGLGLWVGVSVSSTAPDSLPAHPSYVLCCFGAQKVLQQGVASEENIGFCPVTPTTWSETPGIW